ncbi:MAG: universal stress protein [Thermodesulfobacteriota bacterium]
MIKKILFPVDLSEASPLIAPLVKDLAGKYGAEVKVLFVARTMDHYLSMHIPHTTIQNFEQELFSKAQAHLAEFMETHFKDLPAQAFVVRGHPAEEILSFARKEGVDLIALGTHGRRGLEKILFGSVAEEVVKNSPVPVLTINPFRKPATGAAA